jgi:signal peptide peptidase-like protein 2B
VKVKNWVNGVEATELVGVSARFGETIIDHAVDANAVLLAEPSPFDSCSLSSKNVSGFIRGTVHSI